MVRLARPVTPQRSDLRQGCLWALCHDALLRRGLPPRDLLCEAMLTETISNGLLGETDSDTGAGKVGETGGYASEL